MRRALPLLLVAVALAGRARAIEARLLGEPLRLDFTESLYVSWRGDPGNGDASSAYYGEGFNRLNASAAWRDWLFSTRLDSSGYVSAPQPGETLAKPHAPPGAPVLPIRETLLRNRYEQHPWDPWKGIEKISLSYQGRALEATLGDFYANFGRGLVLSVRKVDELGQDTTILGGKLTVRQGPFTGTALAGVTNIQNLDETTARYTQDPLDRLGAARLELRLFDKVNVAAQGLYGQPATNASQLAETPDRYVRAGFSIDAPRPVDWLALYLEYARREDRRTDQRESGDALYGSATAFAGPVTLLFEGKAYSAYVPWRASNDPFNTLVYQQPPTLERIVTQLTNNTDILAGRLRADWVIAPGRVLFGSAEYGRLKPTPTSEHALVDVYAGTQLRWGAGGHAFPLVAYREERKQEDGALEERLLAFEGSASQPIGDRLSVEAQWLLWRRTKEGLPDWSEGQAYLAFKSAPRFIVAAGYEFTTIVREEQNQHHFVNGTAQWNVTPSTSLKLFAGGQRPGLKCISGLCRVFPAFNGVRLEWVVRG